MRLFLVPRLLQALCHRTPGTWSRWSPKDQRAPLLQPSPSLERGEQPWTSILDKHRRLPSKTCHSSVSSWNGWRTKTEQLAPITFPPPDLGPQRPVPSSLEGTPRTPPISRIGVPLSRNGLGLEASVRDSPGLANSRSASISCTAYGPWRYSGARYDALGVGGNEGRNRGKDRGRGESVAPLAGRRGPEQLAACAATPPGLGHQGPVSQPLAAVCPGRLLSSTSGGPFSRSSISSAVSARASPPGPASSPASASPPGPASANSRAARASCAASGAGRYRRIG